MADPSNTERLRRLEEAVNERVRDAFTGLRGQIAERLRRLSDEAREALEGLGEGEPPAVLAAADLEPLARDAEAAAGARVAGELVAALAALDRARSQGDVLTALAREARRFAARAAVLLTRQDGAELWAAEGWDDAPAELGFDYPPSGGWSPAVFGRGAGELSGDALGELAGRLGGDAPRRAVLVPLVLRDRTAAVLYGEGEAPYPLGAALQALAWAASQALESLPFREREATASLAGLGAGEPAEEALPLWGAAAGAAAALHEAPEAEHGGAGRAVGLAAAGIAAAGLAAAGVARARRHRDEDAEAEAEAEPEIEVEAFDEAGDLAAAEEPGAEEPAAAGEPAETAALGLGDFAELPLEEGPGPEVAAPPVFVPGDDEPALGEATADEIAAAAEEAAAGVPWSEEPAAPPDEEPAAPQTFAPAEPEPYEADPYGPGAESLEAADSDETFVEPVTPAGFAVEPAPPPEAAEPIAAEDETHPTPAPEATAAQESAAAEAADETYPGFATSPPAPPAAAPPVAPAAEPPRPAGAAEVAPPADLEGPGRAFAGRGAAAQDEEQSRHDEARRLARLLVSEIRLYNEEEVEAGRRHGDVYERLKEDIDRSRQLYDERVDPRVREATDYFYQELVRNLGGGDARALGIESL